MKVFLLVIGLHLFSNCFGAHLKAIEKDEECGQKFIEKADRIMGEYKNMAALADWDQASNITETNNQKQVYNS